MQDLAMHLLEIVMNSLTHNSSLIDIKIIYNTLLNRIFFEVIDNGCGMDEELLKDITNPFKTTRKTRKIGMGLAFIQSLVDMNEGNINITSKINEGTCIKFDVKMDSIDLPPLGNIGELIMFIYNHNPNITLDFTYKYDDYVFTYRQKEIEEEIGEIDFSDSDILLWIKDYINEGIIKNEKYS